MHHTHQQLRNWSRNFEVQMSWSILWKRLLAGRSLFAVSLGFMMHLLSAHTDMMHLLQTLCFHQHIRAYGKTLNFSLTKFTCSRNDRDQLYFCGQSLYFIKDNWIILEWINFTDEAHFLLNGYICKQNMLLWNIENIHKTKEIPLCFIMWHALYLQVLSSEILTMWSPYRMNTYSKKCEKDECWLSDCAYVLLYSTVWYKHPVPTIIYLAVWIEQALGWCFLFGGYLEYCTKMFFT